MSKAQTETEKKVFEKEFTSDVKKHLDSIANKYILTNEGTIDYALMYIPSEAVYYEMINNPGLLEYAAERRVLPVSPMTFYAYLISVMIGFEGQKITAQTKEILAGIRSMQKDYEKVSEGLDTLSKHVTNSFNTMTNVQTGFGKLGVKIKSTASIKDVDSKLIED